jgi:hypothetical protein
MQLRSRSFDVAGANAVKRTFEADEVASVAFSVVNTTVVRVIAACMVDKEAAINSSRPQLLQRRRTSNASSLSPL